MLPGGMNPKQMKKMMRSMGIKQVEPSDEIMVITKQGKVIRTKVSSIRVVGRNSQGLKVINLDSEDLVVSVAKLAEKAAMKQ